MRPRVMKSTMSLLALGLGLASIALPVASSSASEPRVAVAGSSPVPHGDTVVARAITASFDVTLRQDHAAALGRFIASLSDPASANYRHFLTTSEFARRFGASSATVAAVSRYFAGYGLHVGGLSRGRILLHVSGPTTAMSRAFAAPVATVRRRDGVLVPQLRATGTLPGSIAHDVTAVAGLSAVVAPSPAAQARATSNVPTTCPAAGNSTGNAPNALGGFTLQQQATLYGLSGPWASGHTGVGQSIGVYELGGYNPSDLATYFSCYGINPSVTNVNVDGGPGAGYTDEATLDIEETAGLAPGATIKVYQGPNSNLGPTDTYQQMADDNTVSIITTSWGTCESDPNGAPNAEQPIFAQMAAQGQTVFSAAGDNGSSDCSGVTNNQQAVDDPSSQPYVTGVGGLTISSINPLSQTVWNSGSSGGAGGGGVSLLWSRPSWQNAPGIAASQTMRTVPDLSVMGDPGSGFIEYFSGTGGGSGGWGSIGGTSIGAPLMSAVAAIAAQSCGVSRLGFLNPTLYAMAATGYNDVTTGSNDIFNTGGFSATTGYDLASGLGSPNPATFLGGLCPIAFDAARSSFSLSSTRVLANATGASLTARLRDSNGHPMPNAIVDITAAGTTGRILIDGDPSSALGGGSAAYSVTADSSGNATFEVSNSASGAVVVTLSFHAQTIYKTTIDFVSSLASTRAVPGRPSIARVSPLTRGFRLTVIPPAQHGSSSVTGYQYSLNGGATWTSLPRRATSVTVGGLPRRKTYSIIVRALNAVGHSAASAAKRIVTK